eukprot:1143647-Pelagomonas_calceolata.AAC.1
MPCTFKELLRSAAAIVLQGLETSGAASPIRLHGCKSCCRDQKQALQQVQFGCMAVPGMPCTFKTLIRSAAANVLQGVETSVEAGTEESGTQGVQICRGAHNTRMHLCTRGHAASASLQHVAVLIPGS